MSLLSERYRWEAETAAGQITTAGGDLAGCVRFSLIPREGLSLPRHDMIGVDFVRRFCRAFHKVKFNTERLSGLFFWEDKSKFVRTSESQDGRVIPGDLIGKGVAGEKWFSVASVTPDGVLLTLPYRGISKPNGMQAKRLPREIGGEYLHCVVCKTHRLYVRSSDGAALVTPFDFELYL